VLLILSRQMTKLPPNYEKRVMNSWTHFICKHVAIVLTPQFLHIFNKSSYNIFFCLLYDIPKLILIRDFPNLWQEMDILLEVLILFKLQVFYIIFLLF
jgi:hypothetical protein